MAARDSTQAPPSCHIRKIKTGRIIYDYRRKTQQPGKIGESLSVCMQAVCQEGEQTPIVHALQRQLLHARVAALEAGHCH